MNSSFPRLLLITDPQRMPAGLELSVLAALQAGARWIQFRDKSAAPREVMVRFGRVQRLTEKFGARLFLNGRSDLARWCHAEGLHLPQTEIPVEAARAVLGFHTPIGVSVHSLEQAQQAQKEGASYLTFGSVFATNSHPGGEPAGLEGLAAVSAATSLPVYAVGGISPENAGACLQAGAAGVAVIGAAWSRGDVAAAVKELLEALGESTLPLAYEAHGHPALENAPKSPLAAIIEKQGK